MLAALLVLASGAAFPAPADRAKKVHLTIARGSLSSVLEQFSRQTGLQVGTQLNVSESQTQEIGAFIGRATIDEALTALLKGTDLSYTWQDEYTIRVFVTVVKPPRSEDNVHEVLVTGTRLPDAEDGPVPVRVLGLGKIEGYGVSSVSDLSRYLTQQPFSFSGGYLQSGAQFFQMRGLGFDTTLVLINGRRVPPSANSISLNAVDMNSVPVTAVDRIEVMSDSASAIYGADAIGGVVNVILKDKIAAPEAYLHYGLANGGSTQRRAAASFGTDNDRLKSAVVLDYFEQGALMGAERDLWRNQDYRRFGGQDYRVSTTNPGNVYSLTGQALPGLSSSRAAIPVGSSGIELTPSDFLATDGLTHLDSPFSAWSITPRSTRTSAYGSAEYSFNSDVTAFGEFLFVNSEVTSQRPPPSLTRQFVPASNPFNPFKVPVAVDYLFAGMRPTLYTSDTDLQRIVAGARGTADRWEWEISGLKSQEHGSNTTIGGIDRARVTAAVNSQDPNTALNLFSDGPAGSPALLESLIGPRQELTFSFASSQLSGFVRGPMLSIGDQSVDFVLGGEWRRDEAGFFESKRVDVDREVVSAFAEIKVPLLDNLGMKIAARTDDYGHGEQVLNPQYGLTWRPAKDWLLRASYGTSFRPPSLFELHMPLARLALPIADPLRGGEVSSVDIVVGGNPDLEVVTARSFTTGFVFSPSELPDLRIGGSYWKIAMDDRIMVPLYQELLRSPETFPGRVVRSTPSSQDIFAGRPGPLQSIEITRINYGDLETSGVDLDASFLLERNRKSLELSLAITWIDEYLSRDMNRALPLDRVGIANVQGTIPEWRVVGTVTWKSGNFGASTTTTFTPSYQDADALLGELDRRIGSQFLIDLQAWADVELEGDSLITGSRFTLGARNVLNEAPEFAIAGGVSGYDFSQAELTQRFWYVRFSKRF